MRRITFLILIAWTGSCFGQFTYTPYSIDNTVETDKTKAAMFEIAKDWFNNPSAVKKRIELSDAEAGEITGEFTFRFVSESKSMKALKLIGTITCKGSVFVKAGAYRYYFHHFIHAGNYHAPGGDVSFGIITTDTGCPYPEIKGGKKWKNDVWDELKGCIDKELRPLIVELRNMMEARAQSPTW